MRVDDYCHATIRATRLALETQAVLWAIAYYVNRRDGTTFVSQRTVGNDIGLSWRQVQRHIAALRDAGVFTVVTAPGRPNVYRFPIHPALSTTHVTDDVTPTSFSDVPTHVMQDTDPRHAEHKPTSQLCRPNQENHVRNRDALRPLPRPELVKTGLYDETHWEAM